MGMGFPAERTRFFQAPFKIGVAISGPRTAGKTSYGHEDFSEIRQLQHPYCRPALSGGMDWWRMEWPFSRVRKIFFRGRNFQENP